jgi:transcriptional regulator with XRE-family HTH domain
MTIFSDWLEIELATRKMSPADLARSMRKDQGIISRILNGERFPNPKTLTSIAHALHLPPDNVFRIAGLLPPKPEKDVLIDLIAHLSTQLPTEEDKNDVAEYVRLRLRIAEERGKYETANKKQASKT